MVGFYRESRNVKVKEAVYHAFITGLEKWLNYWLNLSDQIYP